ncbi:MAG: hypothetical protein ACT443_10250 [Gemmatimonadota bacterium]
MGRGKRERERARLGEQVEGEEGAMRRTNVERTDRSMSAGGAHGDKLAGDEGIDEQPSRRPPERSGRKRSTTDESDSENPWSE